MKPSDVFSVTQRSQVEWGHFVVSERPTGPLFALHAERSTATSPAYRLSMWCLHINRGPAFAWRRLTACVEGRRCLLSAANCRRVCMDIAAFEQDLLGWLAQQQEAPALDFAHESA